MQGSCIQSPGDDGTPWWTMRDLSIIAAEGASKSNINFHFLFGVSSKVSKLQQSSSHYICCAFSSQQRAAFTQVLLIFIGFVTISIPKIYSFAGWVLLSTGKESLGRVWNKSVCNWTSSTPPHDIVPMYGAKNSPIADRFHENKIGSKASHLESWHCHPLIGIRAHPTHPILPPKNPVVPTLLIVTADWQRMLFGVWGIEKKPSCYPYPTAFQKLRSIRKQNNLMHSLQETQNTSDVIRKKRDHDRNSKRERAEEKREREKEDRCKTRRPHDKAKTRSLIQKYFWGRTWASWWNWERRVWKTSRSWRILSWDMDLRCKTWPFDV